MATFIAKNGSTCELTSKIIKSIRRKVVEDMEVKNYEKLSDHYKKQYSLHSWLKTQVIGRLFMTGDKSNDVYSEFYKTYFQISYNAAKGILKDGDLAAGVVQEQFNTFVFRKLYTNNGSIADQRNIVKKLHEQKEEKVKELYYEKYNENKDYDRIQKEIIPSIEKEIKEEENILRMMIMKESELEKDKLKEYDGMTYEEIYNSIQSDLVKEKLWFNDGKPISGYIVKSVRNLSIQTYNDIKKERVIIASRLQKNGINKDEELSEDGIIDIASAKQETNIYDYILNDEFDSIDLSQNYELNDLLEDGEYEFVKMIHISDEAMIKRVRELCELCGENSGILIDFIFNGMKQRDIRIKYNLNTDGAIKSRVSRTRMKIREQVLNEKETEEIYERRKANGTIYLYFKDRLCQLKETAEIKNSKKDGVNIQYFENGSIKLKRNYKNGQLDGDFIQYHENGSVKIKGQYKDGKRIGIWKRGSENCVMEEEMNYKEDGSYEFKIYNEMGEIETVGMCDKNGDITSQVWNGEFIQEWKNGNIKVSGYYKDGKKCGQWKRYDEHGNIEEIVEFLPDGSYEFVIYDEIGNIESKGKYDKNGNLQQLN